MIVAVVPALLTSTINIRDSTGSRAINGPTDVELVHEVHLRSISLSACVDNISGNATYVNVRTAAIRHSAESSLWKKEKSEERRDEEFRRHTVSQH
jgi:hypothetical protein